PVAGKAWLSGAMTGVLQPKAVLSSKAVLSLRDRLLVMGSLPLTRGCAVSGGPHIEWGGPNS
ncbi:MAG: hypothetical protein NNA25_13255, partial [Nitrospira sp.]|nr:hypothetical protein [Nitrospira sp.]